MVSGTCPPWGVGAGELHYVTDNDDRCSYFGLQPQHISVLLGGHYRVKKYLHE